MKNFNKLNVLKKICSQKTLTICLSLAIVVIAGCSGLFVSTETGVTTKCDIVKGRVTWKYCVTESIDSSTPEILYYFHGGGGSEKSWAKKKNYTYSIRKFWKKYSKYSPPVVVTISFGPRWILDEKKYVGEKGYFEIFVKEVMPYIESKVLFKPSRRTLLGESMGAYSVAQLVMKKPKLFEKAALICPALYYPYKGDNSSIEEYVNESKAKKSYARKLYNLMSIYFPDYRSKKENSPITQAVRHLDRYSPKLYISSGINDEYGFYYGAKMFSAIAKKKGVDVTWRAIKGGHCSVDSRTTAMFLNP